MISENEALRAEVESLRAFQLQPRASDLELRMHSTVYERAAWQHDIGEHNGSDFPYGFCPRCEMEHPKGRLAEVLAVIKSAGQVVWDHPHADTCATELSPDAGYPCSCWRGDLIVALTMPTESEVI